LRSSVKIWLESLTKLYIIFSITPWQRKIHKSIRKEKKYYFQDWFFIPEISEGARFENMVAVGLKHLCNVLVENGLGSYDLFFIRDLAKREVDFLIAKGEKPVLLVEAKSGGMNLSGFARNLSKKLDNIPLLQLTNQPNILKRIDSQIWIMSASHFFSCFP
jgi:predicted AAA+ superfamily ATPase